MKRTVFMSFLIGTLVLFAALIAAFAFISPIGIADALNLDLCDQVFAAAVNDLSGVNGEIRVEASKRTLYGMDLLPLGVAYDFSVNGKRGFAILIEQDGQVEINEIYFDAVDPYENIDAQYPVYAKLMTYIASDGAIFTFLDGTPIPDEALENLLLDGYYGGGTDLSTSSEQVSYVNRTENKHEINFTHPNVTSVPDTINACVPIAAGCIVEYWDKDCKNLIPNFEPGRELLGHYIFMGQAVEVDETVQKLYDDMGTNNPNPGTTVSQFKSGLTKFCQRQGYSVSINSCMKSGVLDYSKAKSEFDNGNTMMIFMSNFFATTIQKQENADWLASLVCPVGHAMAAFGYNEITYTLSDGSTRFDKYFAVSTGLINMEEGYLNLDKSVIDDAYSVRIS